MFRRIRYASKFRPASGLKCGEFLQLFIGFGRTTPAYIVMSYVIVVVKICRFVIRFVWLLINDYWLATRKLS